MATSITDTAWFTRTLNGRITLYDAGGVPIWANISSDVADVLIAAHDRGNVWHSAQVGSWMQVFEGDTSIAMVDQNLARRLVRMHNESI